MGETPQPEQRQGTAAAQTEEPADPAAVLQEKDPHVGAENASGPTKGRRYWEAFKDRGFSRTMEALITTATVVNVWIAIEQRDAMEDANKRADRAIAEAKGANKIALDTLITSERQAEADRREAAKLAESNRADANATLEAMKESNRITRKSNEAAGRAFRHEARARLVAVGFTSSGKHPLYWDGEFSDIRITIRNVGNADAMVTVRGGLRFSKYLSRGFKEGEYVPFAEVVQKTSDFPPHPQYDELPILNEMGDVPVRRGGSADFYIVSDKLEEPPELNAFETGTLQADVVGYIIARDELGEVSRTYICASLNQLELLFQGGRVTEEGIYPQKTPEHQDWEWQPCPESNLEERP